MQLKLIKSVALATLVASAAPAVADTNFGVGSLILPSNATYQDRCGSVAVYGFVYDLLRANPWLKANGYGTIEVYYAYKDTKLSPNRCTPTNLHKGAAYSASASGQTPSYPAQASPTDSDAKWNDGCDFEVVDNITSATLPPSVKLVNKSSVANACAPTGSPPYTSVTSCSSDTSIATIDTTSMTDVSPRWATKTIAHSTSSTTNVTTVRYSGGPFIISDDDAPVVLRLITGGLIANDKADGTGNNIDFSPFKASSCTFGTTTGGNVAIHRAYHAFTAPTPKIFTTVPPRLALLAYDKNGSTGGIFNGILQNYLKSAGLNFTGAQGCPSGGVYSGNTSFCPAPNYGTSGQIYDLFDVQDIVDGRLDPANYKMLWAPHWDGKSSTLNSTETSMLSKVSTFLDSSTGLMAECASIESFEGADVGYGSPTAAASTSQQLQTCKGTGTTCTSTLAQYGIQKNSQDAYLFAKPSGLLPNCSDMTLSAGAQCAYFGYPGDSYSQTGDFMWKSNAFSIGSQVGDYKPNTTSGAIYKPGVLPLISGVNSLVKTGLNSPTAARSMINGDYTSRNNKDNDPTKANILYLAGHDMTSTVSGTKVVLETLLQLGAPTVDPTVDEVARSSPIVGTVGGSNAFVQGTFERVTPAYTTTTANTPTELTTFRFPDLVGHMRAINLTAVTTSETDYQSLNPANVMFDAATLIPSTANTYSPGCGSSAFKGTCRTIFTTTTSGRLPTRLLFQGGNVSTIGAVMANGSTLATTDYPTLMKRIIAGRETTTGSGVYTAKLGGVDHSTVAVIPESLVAGTTRPTMIYFGATDGMLHAVCGSVDAAKGCDVLGRELWAFIPRLNLQRMRKNTAKVDGSPRVVDLYGDFQNNGSRSFRTILLFQTGAGDTGVSGEQPSTTALDITDVNDPVILWDYAAANSTPSVAAGQGLVVNAGKVKSNNNFQNLAFIQTNNGGSGGAGNVVTAVDVETGTQEWQTGYVFANPPRGAGTAIPTSGIPGGAVGVDKDGTGALTDVVFGTLYGDIWMLTADKGLSKHGIHPLFQYSSNLHPFGAPPTIYSNSSQLYALMVPGAYVDPSAAALWSTSAQTAVAVSLSTPNSAAPVNESSGSPYVPFTFALNAGDKSFSQAVVIGGEVFITADSQDVNALTYGTGAATDTGTVYKVNLNTGSGTTVVVAGGAGSVANNTTDVYTGSKGAVQQIGMNAAGTTGETVNSNSGAKVIRRLWLRTL